MAFDLQLYLEDLEVPKWIGELTSTEWVSDLRPLEWPWVAWSFLFLGIVGILAGLYIISWLSTKSADESSWLYTFRNWIDAVAEFVWRVIKYVAVAAYDAGTGEYSKYFFRPLFLAIFLAIIFYTREHVVPPCYPWRDNGVQLLAGFPYATFISQFIIYSCRTSGHARDAAILNVATFNRLVTASHYLSQPLLTATNVKILRDESRLAFDWISDEAKRGVQVPKSVAQFKHILADVDELTTTFFSKRGTFLHELDDKLQAIGDELKERYEEDTSETIVGSFKNNILLRKPWSHDEKYQLQTTAEYHGLLDELTTDTTELLALVHSAKEKVESIGQYIILLRHLRQSHGSAAQKQEYFRQVTGADPSEIFAFQKWLKPLDQPSLELIVFNMLPELKSARKELKKITKIKGKGDGTLNSLGRCPEDKLRAKVIRDAGAFVKRYRSADDVADVLPGRLQWLGELKRSIARTISGMPDERKEKRYEGW